MDPVQSITNPIREKGKHLTFENRVVIQNRLRDRWFHPQNCTGTELFSQYRAQ